MTFISYAQNFEDVMLWRALKHIDKGCYVDIGAQHPVVHSVSKAFYEHGWRGVHLEPVPYYADLLRTDRPDETVMQIALSDTEGFVELNVIPDTGLSTVVDKHAVDHAKLGFKSQKLKVKTLPLSKALQSLNGKDVHWLKIDVEGLEESVLRGWDSKVLRPWVLVVEATLPMTQDLSHEIWDPIVAAAGYQFVYFDGLNRFYVANEHNELLPSFLLPPNVFDDFTFSSTSHFVAHLINQNDATLNAKNYRFLRWIYKTANRVLNIFK